MGVDLDLTLTETVDCADGPAERTLRRALPTLPRPTALRVAFARLEGGTVLFARMSSDAHVAERTFRAPTRNCDGLARAVSAWASITSDGWAEDDAKDSATNKTTGGAAPNGPVSGSPLGGGASVNDPAGEPSAESSAPSKVASTTPQSSGETDPSDAKGRATRATSSPKRAFKASTDEKDDAEPSGSRGIDEDGTTRFELGAGVHVSDGVGNRSNAGPTLSTAIVVDGSWVAREQLLVSSSSFQPENSHRAGWFALASEGCHRSHGNYVRGSGISFEACAHLEGGSTVSSSAFGFVSAGPAIALRGDVGDIMAFEFRAVGLWHAAKPSHVGADPEPAPDFGGRGEISILARAW